MGGSCGFFGISNSRAELPEYPDLPLEEEPVSPANLLTNISPVKIASVIFSAAKDQILRN